MTPVDVRLICRLQTPIFFCEISFLWTGLRRHFHLIVKDTTTTGKRNVYSIERLYDSLILPIGRQSHDSWKIATHRDVTLFMFVLLLRQAAVTAAAGHVPQVDVVGCCKRM